MELKFTLNTTFDYFHNWLRHTVEQARSQQFLTGDGPFYLQLPIWTQAAVGVDTLTVNGLHDPSDPDSDPVITFDLIAVAPDRVQVISKCHHPDLSGYYHEHLLLDIASCWSEAREPIGRFIARWRSDHNAYMATLVPQLNRPLIPTPAAPPEWLPTTPRTIDKWRTAYTIIRVKRQVYRRAYHELETDDPNPHVDDLRETLAALPDWPKKPARRTVRRIIQAGDNGWLD